MKEITLEIKQNNQQSDNESIYNDIKTSISELTLFTSKQKIFLGEFFSHKIIISLYEPPPTEYELNYISEDILNELDSHIQYVLKKKICKTFKYMIHDRIYFMKIRVCKKNPETALIFIDELSKKYDIDNLLEIQENYKIVINNLHEGVLITRDSKILSLNNQLLRIFEYDFPELFEKNILKFVHPDDKQSLLNGCNINLKKDITFTHEFRIITKSKKIKWIHCNLIQFKLENKSLILAFIRDITKEKEDVEKKTTFGQMVQASNAAMVLVDEEGHIIHANPASFIIAKNYDGTYLDVLGKNALNYILKKDRKKIQDIKNSIDKYGIWKGEINIKAYDKSIVPTEMVCSKIINGNNQILYLGNYVDITEKKEIQKKLKLSEERYRTLFNSSMDAILLICNYKIIDCNEATIKLFNYQKNEIIGKHPGDISIKNDSLNYLILNEKIDYVLKTGNPLRFEWIHVKFPDIQFYTEISLTLAEINSNKYVQAIISDINEKKINEKILIEKNKMIENMAAQQSLLLNNLDVHVWYLTSPDTYGFVNNAHASFFGISNIKMINQKLHNVFNKNNTMNNKINEEIQENEEIFKSGNNIEIERWFIDRNNMKRLLKIKKIPKFDINKNVEFVVCWCYDVTDVWEKNQSAENYRAMIEKKILDYIDETENNINEKYEKINEKINDVSKKIPILINSQIS